MRSGTLIAIIVAAVIVIGGILWYNAQTTPIDAEVPVVEDEPLVGDDDALTEDEAVLVQPDPLDPEAPVDPAAPPADVADDGAGDAPIVVGDEITEDSIVVESATDEPVILDPEETSSSVEFVDEAEPAEAGAGATEAAPGQDAAAAGGDAATEEADAAGAQAPTAAETDAAAPADTATTAQPDAAAVTPDSAEVLTPGGFDSAQVLELLAGADQLSAEQRSSLRALVDGAAANPALRDTAISAVRAALNLPALN